jgi:hypothetical protein
VSLARREGEVEDEARARPWISWNEPTSSLDSPSRPAASPGAFYPEEDGGRRVPKKGA